MAGSPLRIVVLFRFLGYVRLFDGLVRTLLERGHHVHLLYEREIWTAEERAWLDELERHPRFSSALTDALRRDRSYVLGARLRRVSDYVHYLAPRFASMSSLVAKSAERVEPRTRECLERLVAGREGRRRLLLRLLTSVEAALPSSRPLEAELSALGPDVLVLVPHLMPGNRHSEYVKAARAIGLPTCVCVASWDNLTSKQPLREIPDRLVVWNDLQRREAVELHGIPAGRVEVTGAQSFDDWFERRPRPRAELCSLVGLDPVPPYVLYLGGALFAAERTEAGFVRETWIPALRADPRLRDLGVLVRPHPRRLDEWDAATFSTLGGVAVWPRDGGMPVEEESRRDFYDSIAHSAVVVGLNTTAMIEAAVVGRPVYTLLLPEFAESQTGTKHFAYLLEAGGGLLRVARSLEEHLDQLAALRQAGDEEARVRRERFLGAFVRPRGLEEPVTPQVAAVVEDVAARGPLGAARREAWLPPLRVLLQLVLAGARAARVAASRLRAR